jgi:predicted alpha/beta-hydrolase family hydrolase
MKPWSRARIEFGYHLSRPSGMPTFSPNTREGRDSMRRIIAAVAALVALVLGGGAGFTAY